MTRNATSGILGRRCIEREDQFHACQDLLIVALSTLHRVDVRLPRTMTRLTTCRGQASVALRVRVIRLVKLRGFSAVPGRANRRAPERSPGNRRSLCEGHART